VYGISADDSNYVEKAYTLIRNAYQLDNNDFRIIGLLAEIAVMKKDYDRALQYLDKAISIFFKNNINPSQFITMKESILSQIEESKKPKPGCH